MQLGQPLLEFSCNNHPLPDALVPEWSAFLDTLSQAISSQDQNILALKRQLESLSNQRFENCKQRDLVASLRSAVRHLPPELIAQIMFYALELDRKPLSHAGRIEFITLRSVSSLWRKTALTTPYLWRSLAVHFSQGAHPSQALPPPLASTLVGKIEAWFSRGGLGAAVHLSVQGSTPGACRPWEALVPFIHASSFAFSSLQIGPGILRSRIDLADLLAMPHERTGAVRHLNIFIPYAYADESDSAEEDSEDEDGVGLPIPNHLHRPANLANVFPAVQSLTLSGYIRGCAFMTHPTLKSLSFEITSTTFDCFADFPQRFPCLEELTVPGSVFTSTTAMPLIHLPFLKRLILTDIFDATRPTLVSRFVCPDLRYLHLTGRGQNRRSKQLAFAIIGLLVRSQAKAITLRVSARRDPGVFLSELFATFLPIHTLHVDNIEWLDPLQPAVLLSNFPSSLARIVSWSKPLRRPKTIGFGDITDSGGSWGLFGESGTISGWSNTSIARETSQNAPPRIVEVYVLGEREEGDMFTHEYGRRAGPIHLRFHCITQASG